MPTALSIWITALEDHRYMTKKTPMMEQYYTIKKRNTGSILLFRLGDFYEMFEDDALEASRILNITLTKRNSVPMCGFPHHAAKNYISRLLLHGKKIAVCEQTEDPSQAKGIVNRDVVEVMSPGIITDPDLLIDKKSNCIAAVFGSIEKEHLRMACASLDVSTGEFVSSFFHNYDIADSLSGEIEDNGIRELVYPASFTDASPFSTALNKAVSLRPGVVIRRLEDYEFSANGAEETLKRHFGLQSIGAFEFEDSTEICACGTLLSYVIQHAKQDLSHVRWIRKKRNERILFIDNATKKHLELVENAEGKEYATLLELLDKTQTAMGGRLLKKIINNPSRSIEEIKKRLDRVSFFFSNPETLQVVRGFLAQILDIERIISKLSMGKGNARDILGLSNSLSAAESITGHLDDATVLKDETDALYNYNNLIQLIEQALADDPPLSVHEGGIIREGYSEKLDTYRQAMQENREWINRYQKEEQKKHGIGSLKLRYNKIIGYFIEVTKSNLHLVPEYYLKKQTTLNAERFTTEELTGHETLLLEARQKSDELEFQIFQQVSTGVLEYTERLFETSEVVARLDVFCSLARTARENGYVKPEILEDTILEIRDGRHPVVERLGEEEFIGNDLFLDSGERRIMILTGPNMSGKSTYLRQAALIVIMAHMGCYVPAKSARIGVVDRIFSRIGASDRLIRGESTFLVEMIETARILHFATDRSFIIMDEIGRGTSTYDGLSIAWAVLEHLLDVNKVGAKVLFATHYHEITALKDSYGVINCNAAVKEWNDSIVFLRKVVPGSASKSYGIEVARMAGIPEEVIERAKVILSTLETKYGAHMPLMIEDKRDAWKLENQLDLFPSPYDILIKELRTVDVNSITPLEAMNILDRLKKSITL